MNYLFLDTQVFDLNAYDFQSKHFRLVRALGESKDVCLLMPEITRREIERHIAAKAKETYAALEKFRRQGFHKNLLQPPFDAITKGTTEEAIRTELMGHFNEFCYEANVTHLPAKGLYLADVLDDYFNQRPPFGEGQKKSEFPDAFTAKILTAWCEEQSREAIVVSGDRDWATIVHPKLEILDNIAKFLERFPDHIIAEQLRDALKKSTYFIEAVKKAFEETKLYDREYGAEIKDLEASNVEVGWIGVIEISGGFATVEADVYIDHSAHVDGRTRLRSYRYGDGHGQDDWISGKVTDFTGTTATVELSFKADDPSAIEFRSVSLEGMSPYMDVRELFG
jgi:hypothetical protein